MDNHPESPTSSEISGLCHPHWTSWPHTTHMEGVWSPMPGLFAVPWKHCLLVWQCSPSDQPLFSNGRSTSTPFFLPIMTAQGSWATKVKCSRAASSPGIYPFSSLDFPSHSHPYPGPVSWSREPRWHIVQLSLNSCVHTVLVNGEFLAEELNPSWAPPAIQAWDKASPGAKQLLGTETTRGWVGLVIMKSFGSSQPRRLPWQQFLPLFSFERELCLLALGNYHLWTFFFLLCHVRGTHTQNFPVKSAFRNYRRESI